jgi:hypothetical protein
VDINTLAIEDLEYTEAPRRAVSQEITPTSAEWRAALDAMRARKSFSWIKKNIWRDGPGGTKLTLSKPQLKWLWGKWQNRLAQLTAEAEQSG